MPFTEPVTKKELDVAQACIDTHPGEKRGVVASCFASDSLTVT